MAYLIGLTGNIACGKSSAGRHLVELGAEYLDTDELVHQLLAAGTPESERVIARFGPAVRAPDGSVDRSALGALVFRDPVLLAELEEILHPAVTAMVRARAARTPAVVLVIDGIKIVEAGLADELDELWVVTCIPEVQRARLAEQRRLNSKEVEERLAAQPPMDEKLQRADVVIDNSGSLEETYAQVDQAFGRSLAHLRPPL